MNSGHPITLFLLKHGFLIRGFTIGIIVTTMLKTGFWNLTESPSDSHSYMLYVGIFLMSSFAPSIGSFAFAPFWQKITPIKDKVTYAEDEVVFVGSTMIGLSASLFFWGFTSISEGLMISLWAITAALPVFFLIWFTKSALTPVHTVDTSEATAAAQTYRDETPHFWNNAVAYAITGVITSLVITLVLALIIIIRGGSFSLMSGCLSFASMTLINIFAAPIFIFIGKKFKPKDTSPNGVHFALGGIAFLSVIVTLNLPVIFRDGTNLPDIVDAWPFAVAYSIMVLSYVAGGLVFSKLYKPRPLGLEFA